MRFIGKGNGKSFGEKKKNENPTTGTDHFSAPKLVVLKALLP